LNGSSEDILGATKCFTVKNLLFLFSALIVLLTDLSCTKKVEQRRNLREIASQKIYSAEITIDENASPLFDEEFSLDMTNSNFLVNSLGGVFNYRIEAMQLSIINYSASESINADFEIFFTDSTMMIGNPLLLSNVPLADFHSNQISQFINFNYETRALVEDVLNEQHQIFINLIGSVDGQPLLFEPEIKIQINVKGY